MLVNVDMKDSPWDSTADRGLRFSLVALTESRRETPA
jgi:hypothetical protein